MNFENLNGCNVSQYEIFIISENGADTGLFCDIWVSTIVVDDIVVVCRADSRSVPSQWETALLCNDVSHWLDASLESALWLRNQVISKHDVDYVG